MTDPSNPSPATTLNYERALVQCSGNQGLLDRLLVRFVEQLDGEVPQLEASLAEGKATRAREVAHKLKGSAATLAAEELQMFAKEIEELARNGDVASARDRLPHFREAVGRLRQEINQRTPKGK